MTNFDAILQRLDLGDAAFGAKCRPPLARGQIWSYRNGRKTPRSDTALVILAALKQEGVEIELKELLSPDPVPVPRRRTG